VLEEEEVAIVVEESANVVNLFFEMKN